MEEVDRLIAEHHRFGVPTDRYPATNRYPGVGLVVADRPDRIGVLHDALHLQLGQVWTAGDAPSATAVAITEQPDIAVIDDELVGCSGFDLALMIKEYSPATSVVLIIDDHFDTDGAQTAVADGAVTSMGRLGQTILQLL